MAEKSIAVKRIVVVKAVEFPVDDLKSIAEFAGLAKALDTVFPLDIKADNFSNSVQLVKTELIDKVKGNNATVITFKGIKQNLEKSLAYEYSITLGELLKLTGIKVSIKQISKKGKKAVDPAVKQSAIAGLFSKAVGTPES
jgi:hypothetical protein